MIPIKQGLDLPITGAPVQEVTAAPLTRRTAVVGEDFVGMKPSLEVAVGDSVRRGSRLFTDRKNPGVVFTAPAAGTVGEINRGAKRSFESLVIETSGIEDEPAEQFGTVDDNDIALLQFRSGCLATVEASWIQTGGLSGLEVVGSKATLFNHPQDGYITVAPGQDAHPLADGTAKPTRVDRLVAAIQGDLSAAELEADLLCAADAVAIIEACYQSNQTGAWTTVETLA